MKCESGRGPTNGPRLPWDASARRGRVAVLGISWLDGSRFRTPVLDAPGGVRGDAVGYFEPEGAEAR